VSGSVAILVVVIVGLIIFGAVFKLKKNSVGATSYEKQEKLFSTAELSFLLVLDRAVAPGQRVMGKVRLADLISIKRGLSPKTRQIALNRVAQKHVDFVVCTGPALLPVCAIELNDSSHNSASTRRRDEFLSSVCTQVGIPLLVVKAARDPPAISGRQSNNIPADGQCRQAWPARL
jgi:hypothetical protein